MPITVVAPDGRTHDVNSFVAAVGNQPGNTGGGDRGRLASTLQPTEGQGRLIEAIRLAKRQPKPCGVQGVGYAGTGKTTCMKAIGAEHGDPVVIAPTGKAALRVQEATGLQATTLHRWLYEYRPGEQGPSFALKSPDRLWLPHCKLVLVDEASMIGRDVWRDLWAACHRYDLRVALIGDGFQLPPVEKDRNAAAFSTMTPAFAKEHNFPRIELTEIVRQAADSLVVQAATRLRQWDAGGLRLLPQVPHTRLGQACRDVLAQKGVVLCYTNVVRQKANAGLKDPRGLTGGEPLLVLRNDYDLDVYNGQVLRFGKWLTPPADTTVVSDKHRGTVATVRFGVAEVEGQRVVLCPEQVDGTADVGEYPVGDAARLWARTRRHIDAAGAPVPPLHCNYGYCLTTHKAQGSEWPYALVVLERHVRLTEEEGLRWAYTAVTRAKLMAAIHHGSP